MKVIINGIAYSAINSLGFSPEVDLTNSSMPINEFECRIFTNNVIQFGQWAELRDDLDRLWARFWLRYAERIGRDDDKQTYIVRIIGQSPIAFLERVRLPAEYLNDTAYNLIQNVLDYVGNMGQMGDIIRDHVVASDFASIQITGFAPEQTARERLQWLLMTAGGYIQSYFDTVIHINKVSTSGSKVIPIEKTFWKPTVSHRDYVTKIKIHAYTYTQGTPASTDKYVTDGTHYWIVQEQVISLNNSNAPSGAPENIVEIEGVTIISPSRASTIATNLVAYYFDRTEVDVDVINNAEYIPGDRVTVHTDDDQLRTGYVDHADFSFGVQARARLHLTAAQSVDGRTLTILYKWGDIQIASQTYFLPRGYTYSITTLYQDISMSGHRYIFRPLTAVVSGTLTDNTTVTVNCEVALDWYSETNARRDANEAQRAKLLSILTDIHNTESSMINKSYKGKSNKKKREKYLEKIDTAYVSDVTRMNAAFNVMVDSMPATNGILHIVSVDQVDYDDEGAIYDPDDRTVVIE